jgi:hypothetical protein
MHGDRAGQEPAAITGARGAWPRPRAAGSPVGLNRCRFPRPFPAIGDNTPSRFGRHQALSLDDGPAIADKTEAPQPGTPGRFKRTLALRRFWNPVRYYSTSTWVCESLSGTPRSYHLSSWAWW